MAQANLSAQRVIGASAKAIDFIASRRGTNAAVSNGRHIQEMLHKLRSLAICALAEGGSGAVVTVTSEEAIWLVEAYEDLEGWRLLDEAQKRPDDRNTYAAETAEQTLGPHRVRRRVSRKVIMDDYPTFGLQ